MPFHAPALAELPDLDPDRFAALVRSLEAQPARLAIFQTGVGTRALFAATDGLGLSTRLISLLEKMLVAVRGPKPSGPLRARGVRIDRSAREPYTTHEVLESDQDIDLQGAQVAVQRHGSVNVELDRALEARGAGVVEIPLIASIGPVASAALREAGVAVGLESRPPKLGALLSSLDEALS